MYDFEFHRPASLEEALEMLERYGDDARLMAGGTALVLQMKQRFSQPAHVVGLRSLARVNGLGAGRGGWATGIGTVMHTEGPGG